MKLKIYLTPDGAEALATGNRVWPWHFSCREVAEDETFDPPVEGAMEIGETEVIFPSSETLIGVAEKKLKAKLQEIRAEAYQEEREVQERLDKLLALPAPTSQEA